MRVGSVPHRALMHAWEVGEVCVCASTLAELENVLRRDKFESFLGATLRAEFADIIRRRSSLFDVCEADLANLHPPCRDTKNNQFLALVNACDADVLVSNDPDLLVLSPWQSVPILTPAAYLDI